MTTTELATRPPCFGPLPDVCATLIRSFLPSTQLAAFRGDRAAQVAAREMFDAPRLRTFFKESFLGRLVVEISSRDDVCDGSQLVSAVWHKAAKLIQAEKKVLNQADYEVCEISPDFAIETLSFDQMDWLGNRIDQKANAILETVFQSIFPHPDDARLLNLLGFEEERIPPRARGAYIKDRVMRQVSLQPIIPSYRYSWGVDFLNCFVDTLAQAQEIFIGRMLAAAVISNDRVATWLILRSEANIHPILLGYSLCKAVKQNNNEILGLIVRGGHRKAVVRFVVQALEIAKNRRNREAEALLERHFPGVGVLLSSSLLSFSLDDSFHGLDGGASE